MADTLELGHLRTALLAGREENHLVPVSAVLVIRSPWCQQFTTTNASDFSFHFVHIEEGSIFKHFIGFKNCMSYTK